MNTEKQKPQLPLTFWKQLAARWAEQNPKFFEIYKNYNWVAIGIVGTLTFIVEVVLPEVMEVPAWLTITNRYFSSAVTFIIGVFSGNVATSNITLKTPDTPAVVTKEDVKAVASDSEVLRLLSSMQQEMAQMREAKNSGTSAVPASQNTPASTE